MGCGKGEVVKILETLGFKYISLSDIVREEATKIGPNLTRKETQDLGNRLRSQEGTGVLGKRIRQKIEATPPTRWVIDGIRNPVEVLELKKLSSFHLIGVSSERQILIERIKERKRSSDNVSESELNRVLDREWGAGEPENGQRVGDCMAMADFLIDNNHRLEDLQKKVLAVLDKI